MQTDNLVSLTQRLTAVELRKLPAERRDAIMEAAAALAEDEYHANAELSAFDAFGKDDLHGDSSSAQTR
jgi:acyl-CoA reductase-like NAD-dependent aldehyde dehydrogenase